MVHLIGGPVPVWMSSVSIVACCDDGNPCAFRGTQLVLTVKGTRGDVWRSPALRFVMFGIMSYFFAILIGSVMAFRSVNEITHFTTFQRPRSALGLWLLHHGDVWWPLLYGASLDQARVAVPHIDLLPLLGQCAWYYYDRGVTACSADGLQAIR